MRASGGPGRSRCRAAEGRARAALRRRLDGARRIARLCGFDARDRVAELEAPIDVERVDVCIPEREVAASDHEEASPDDGSPDE